MSKSVPTGTQQTQTQNQTGQAQLPFLQDLWGRAQELNNSGVGQNFLGDFRNNSNAMAANTLTGPLAYSLMPNAMNFTNLALSGQLPQGNLPAGPQIGQLGDVAGGAIGTGTGYGQGLSGQAFNAINAGLSGRQDLAGLAPGAVGTGTGYGGAIANAAYGAPGAAAPWARGLSGSAGMAIGGNPIYDSLRGMASGQYIDPRTNPAYAGTIQAITDPLVRQYQTATAPQTDSGFEAGGRYGSGVMANARNQDQTNLGMGLGGAISNAVNNMYNTGLQSTLGAGQALGSAYNTGIGNINQALSQGGALDLGALQQMTSGLGTAGQTANQGYSTGSNILSQAGQLGNQGYATGGQMLANAATAANQGYGTGVQGLSQAGTLANTGTLNLGSIAQTTPDLANWPNSQLSAAYNSLWSPLQNYGGIVGPAQTGATQTNTSGTQQQNVVSNILGTALGAASLAKKI